MYDEISSGVVFLASLFKDKLKDENVTDTFCQKLVLLLCDKYRGHWHRNQPSLGNGYRSIACCDGRIDPLVANAASSTSVGKKITACFPTSLTLWIDPNEVAYRIGDQGSICHIDIRQHPEFDFGGEYDSPLTSPNSEFPHMINAINARSFSPSSTSSSASTSSSSESSTTSLHHTTYTAPMSSINTNYVMERNLTSPMRSTAKYSPPPMRKAYSNHDFMSMNSARKHNQFCPSPETARRLSLTISPAMKGLMPAFIKIANNPLDLPLNSAQMIFA